jgi:arylsulfatase A-like enzyme
MVPSDEPYARESWPQVEKNYAATVTLLDSYVGRLLTGLEMLGIVENTLVIFTSEPAVLDENIPAGIHVDPIVIYPMGSSA